MKLTIENISKNYGKKQALNGVSFEMENGVYGLLGPNGAGKSSLIRILAGVMDASGGEILINERTERTVTASTVRSWAICLSRWTFTPILQGLIICAIRPLSRACKARRQSGK